MRELALRAAQQEYAIVFPPYYFGQIFEAKHQPGTLAYSERLIWDLLQETVDEIARNGVKKIILVNGHGGNNSFLPFFCQSQLARRRDYAVYLFQPASDPEASAEIQNLRKTTMDMHGGEVETSTMLAHRPQIVHPERAGDAVRGRPGPPRPPCPTPTPRSGGTRGSRTTTPATAARRRASSARRW